MNFRAQEEPVPTRQSLLERLRRWDDSEGWQEFFDTYWKLIYRAALSSGLSPSEAEEVVQETVISVAKQMPAFQYKPSGQGGSFKRWLYTLTKWRIVDQLRSHSRDRSLVRSPEACDSEVDPMATIPDPVGNRLDSLWEAEWEQNLLEAALEQVKRRTDPRHYQVFYLKVVKNWSALKVARIMNVSIPQVYTVKHRVSKELKVTLAQLREKEAR